MVTEREKVSSEPGIDFKVDRFKEMFRVERIVGFIGGSANESQEVLDILAETMEVVKSQYGSFGVLSGGTRGGIPETVIRIGKSLSLPVIGVYPECKGEYALGELLDLAIPVPSQSQGVTWGCESTVLTGIPDIFVLIGGEYGTLVEVSLIMKQNAGRLKKGQIVTPIVSLKGTGGVADLALCFEQYFSVPKDSLYSVESAQEASQAIIQNFRRQQKCQ